VGWWDGDGATIFRPSPEEAAERIVVLIGGRDKVLKEAEKACEKKEYAWAAQSVNYLYKLDPQDKEVRLFKDKVILFDFQGDHSTVGLHIHRAVAEYLDDPDEHYKPGDVVMSLWGDAWAKLYLSQATVTELAKSKK
jgi:hypothetical protein